MALYALPGCHSSLKMSFHYTHFSRTASYGQQQIVPIGSRITSIFLSWIPSAFIFRTLPAIYSHLTRRCRRGRLVGVLEIRKVPRSSNLVSVGLAGCCTEGSGNWKGFPTNKPQKGARSVTGSNRQTAWRASEESRVRSYSASRRWSSISFHIYGLPTQTAC